MCFVLLIHPLYTVCNAENYFAVCIARCVVRLTLLLISLHPLLQERVDVVVYFLEVLRELITLNNFNGAMEIMSALQNSIIDRLHVTWQVR